MICKYIVLKNGICIKGRIVGKELKRDFGIYDTYTFTISVKVGDNSEEFSFKSVPYMARIVTEQSSMKYCDVYCYKNKYILDNFRAEE